MYENTPPSFPRLVFYLFVLSSCVCVCVCYCAQLVTSPLVLTPRSVKWIVPLGLHCVCAYLGLRWLQMVYV